MTTLKMEPAAPTGELSGPKSALAEATQRAALQQAQVVAGLGSINAIRAEIDDALADMRLFSKSEPDLVMKAVSAHSARLIEISIHIQRIEVVRREWKPVREEADRILNELRNQFQIASRLFAMRQSDWEMSGRGQV